MKMTSEQEEAFEAFRKAQEEEDFWASKKSMREREENEIKAAILKGYEEEQMEKVEAEKEMMRAIKRLADIDTARKAGVDLEAQEARLKALRIEAKRQTQVKESREANPDWGVFG